MRALAADGAAEGSWLRADRQTAGRGRQGREWRSPPGNLYVSTLVRPAQHEPPPATLSLVAAVALHEAVLLFAPDAGVTIKWPNDLMAGGAKLSGILLERADNAVVIGFGVNLAGSPGDVDRPATSVAQLAGGTPESSAFLEVLADGFARWLGRWRGEGLGPIRHRWLAGAHPVGTALETTEGAGLFDGLDEAGALKLRLADGSTRVIRAGDVFLL